MSSYTRVSHSEALQEQSKTVVNSINPPPSTAEEVTAQCKMAWPVVVNMVSYRAPWVISIAFVGRLGEVELASAAMASTLANVSGLSIVIGLSNAQSTLSSQVCVRVCVCVCRMHLKVMEIYHTQSTIAIHL
jgi:Na+-driven multidrug efflux pump